MRLPYSEIADRFGIKADSNVVIDTLLTDSRSLTRPASSLFFAIRTPGGNDGHRFIKNLYDKGVRHFVANEIPDEMKPLTDASFIITDADKSQSDLLYPRVLQLNISKNYIQV